MKRMACFCLVICLMAGLSLTAWASAAEDYSGVTVRLAQQYGMQYAPAYVMKELGILQKHLPGATLEWINLGGGSAMNEALIAGQLDVAFMGMPPALIAMDKGADYRIVSGICVPPAELMVRDTAISSIAELKPTDKIAVPSIGSIQQIMLSIAAEKELGDAKALDNHIVPMANPDAYAALISGSDISCHFASMPYIDLEARQGMKSILKAPVKASIVCVATGPFAGQTEVYQALVKALEESIQLINQQSDEVIQIVAATESTSEEAARDYLGWEGTEYSTTLYGARTLIDYMNKNGYLGGRLNEQADYAWPGVVEE